MVNDCNAYSWEVDEWRDKFNDAQKKLEAAQKEYEFHVRKLEQTVAWLSVSLQEAKTEPCGVCGQ